MKKTKIELSGALFQSYDPRPEPWANLPMLPLGIQLGGEGVTDIDENEGEGE